MEILSPFVIRRSCRPARRLVGQRGGRPGALGSCWRFFRHLAIRCPDGRPDALSVGSGVAPALSGAAVCFPSSGAAAGFPLAQTFWATDPATTTILTRMTTRHAAAWQATVSDDSEPFARAANDRPPAGAGRTSRRRALGRASLARAIGDSSRIRLARLHLPDLPDPRPTALRRLAWELERRTSLIAVPDPIALAPSSPELFRYPLVLLSGDRAFSLLPEAEVARLRRFLTFGGCCWLIRPRSRWWRFRRVGAQAAGACPAGDMPARVPDEHVLWKSFYVLHGVAGRVLAAPYLEGWNATAAWRSSTRKTMCVGPWRATGTVAGSTTCPGRRGTA